jgi:uncharacterized protein YecE (DUF72 family)
MRVGAAQGGTLGKGIIRTGIGGWVFPPWRGNFYPADLPHQNELHYASRQLGTIEINSTYYGAQRAENFRRWHDETPEDFIFAVKGPAVATQRRDLAGAREPINRFFETGVMELKSKLGPVNWQFTATQPFVPAQIAVFLDLLPRALNGQKIRHALEVRHPSFKEAAFASLARAHDVAIVIAGDSEFPEISSLTSDFVYARIMGTKAEEPAGYGEAAIKSWRKRAVGWAKSRDVFLYVIGGHKPVNPAAAMALAATKTPGRKARR